MAIRALELQFNRLFLWTEKLDQLHVLQRDGWNENTETNYLQETNFSFVRCFYNFWIKCRVLILIMRSDIHYFECRLFV